MQGKLPSRHCYAQHPPPPQAQAKRSCRARWAWKEPGGRGWEGLVPCLSLREAERGRQVHTLSAHHVLLLQEFLLQVLQLLWGEDCADSLHLAGTCRPLWWKGRGQGSRKLQPWNGKREPSLSLSDRQVQKRFPRAPLNVSKIQFYEEMDVCSEPVPGSCSNYRREEPCAYSELSHIRETDVMHCYLAACAAALNHTYRGTILLALPCVNGLPQRRYIRTVLQNPCCQS